MTIAQVLAIVMAGIAGTLMTAVFANLIAGVPYPAIAAKPGKYLWAVIYAIPMPWLVTLGGIAVGTVVTFVWLVIAPSAGAKLYWGPKDAPWTRLFSFHAGYALAAIGVYWIVVSALS